MIANALNHRIFRVAALLLAIFYCLFCAAEVYALTAEDRQNLSTPFYSEFIEEDCTTGFGGPANINVDQGFSLGTEAVERRVNLVQALMNDYGLTAEQASGIVGNFMQESGGAHLPPNVNQGGTPGAPRVNLENPGASINDPGYGWAQWSFGRKVAFVQFAIDGGYMASVSASATDAANYAYLKKELSEGYTSTIEELKGTSGPIDAAVSFHRTFERSADNASQIGERGTSAEQVFNEWQERNGGSSGGAGGEGSVSSCGESGGNVAIVDGTAFPLAATKSQIHNQGMFHDGDTDQGGHPYIAYDILVDPGVEVVALIGGTVTRVTEDRCPGRMISIYNAEANLTISYLHLAFSNHVNEGDTVQVGGHVGVVGPASAGCGTPHLHIDAVNGDSRPGCSRNSCPPENRRQFTSIGPQLFETFQQLAD